MRSAFVTGTAGFIGFHLAQALLAEGVAVTGYDAVTDYYEPALKEARLARLGTMPGFRMHRAMLEDAAALDRAVEAAAPDVMVHLAAQAGVRYSLDNPRAYVDANLVGTFNLLEAARKAAPRHLLVASTSSAYGANEKMPFEETDRAEHPLTLYAATKRAGELMGHAYAHLWGIPTTFFRFFTVYGPWGRPDMAPMKFVKATVEGRAIDVYNRGDMKRDFTYVDDLVRAIRLLVDCPPPAPGAGAAAVPGDTLSPVAPWRLVNIGNGSPVPLLDFIDEIERALALPVRRTLMEMQKGDVPATWADTGLLRALTGFAPATPLREGVGRFVGWYRQHYGV